MSYVTMADFLASVDRGLAGRKGRSFEPEDTTGAAAPASAAAPVPQKSYAAPAQRPVAQPAQEEAPQPVAQPAQEAAPSWWGGGASAFFPSTPGGAQPAATQQYAQPGQPDAFAQYAQQQQQQQNYAQPAETPEVGGALGAVLEYIRPAANLKEGSFASTAALEAGGDVMADDDNMGAEQMLYEGLTGGEVDRPANPGLADSVDAGGQGPFVDVATMNTGNWESDDGTGVDVLVEPGQTQAPVQQTPTGGRIDRASSYRTNSNSNGANSNGSGVEAFEPPVFRPASQNGASRNGASQNGASRNGASQNGSSQNGAGRNRITAFDGAAPYIQGTGAATIARPRGFDHVNPPNPASFGLGQTPAPAAPSPGFNLASQIASSAAQVGTAVAVSRTPPQFRAGLPGAQGADYGQQAQAQPQQGSSVTPWIIGALGVGAIAVGVWWFTRPKTTAVQTVQADDEPGPQMVANRPRRSKTKKAKKLGSKAKKSKRR